jgi:AraC-like DNA-binding protein
LGARIGAGLAAADMGPVGMILSLSASVERDMGRIARYADALQCGTRSQWVEDSDQFVFAYRIADRTIWPRRQDAEVTLTSVTQVIRDNFSPRFAPLEVYLEHPPPADPAPLERLFRAPVRYLQPITRLIDARADATRVMRQEGQGLIATLERHIRGVIGEATPLGNTSAATRAVIEAYLGISAITLDRVAAALHLGPCTLQRRLAAENTSLRQLLHEVRHDRAIRLLDQPGTRVGQVAQALGHADPTAFWRAWRDWTGKAPSARRRTGL